MATTRYRAVDLRRGATGKDVPIPMFKIDQDQLELNLLRMKVGDQSVKDTMTWINRTAWDEHWLILDDIVITKPEPNDLIDPVSGDWEGMML